MAMQSGIGLSKILVLAGAGYTSTILLKNGKLSDLLGELQALLNGSGEQSEGDFDAIASQVRRLAAEVRQIGSARQVTVVNGNGGQTGNLTSLIMPAATLGALGYGYMWWKGLKFSDLMYVTKRNMASAVSNLHKHLGSVTDHISKVKKHLTQRVQNLDDKMVEQNELSRSIKEDVCGVKTSLCEIESDLSKLTSLVNGMDYKICSLEEKQDFANVGVLYLVNVVNGKRVEMPEPLKKQLKFEGRSRGLLSHPETPMGLKDIAEPLAITLNQSTDGIVQHDSDRPGEYPRNLMRSVSTRC